MDTCIVSDTTLKIDCVNTQIPSFCQIWRLFRPLRAIGKISQRAITLCLASKWLSAVEIDGDLVVTLGPESVSYPSLTHYLRQAKFGTSKPSIMFLSPHRSSTIQIRLFYSPWANNPSHRCDSSRDPRIYRDLLDTGAWRLAFTSDIFEGSSPKTCYYTQNSNSKRSANQNFKFTSRRQTYISKSESG
jgi:hypothetical protein